MRWGAFFSFFLLSFPRQEYTGGGRRFWAICPGVRGGELHRGAGGCSFRHCRQKAGQSSTPAAVLPSTGPAVPPSSVEPPTPIPGSCLLPPALPQLSLSLLLSRWPLGGRWTSGVYSLRRWRAGWGGASLVEGGGAAVCMCFLCMSLPVVSGSLGCPRPAFPAYALPSTGVTRS